MQTASTQCWWMAQALRSHSRWWLVVSSDETSLYASRSRTSVTDRRLIHTCQPRRTTRKIFRLLSNVNFCGVIDNINTAGPIKRPSSSTNNLLHSITDTVASCYKFHRLSTCLRPLNYVVLFTTITHRFKVRSYFLQTSLQLSSVTSSISDDPLIQFTAKLSFAMQAIAWDQCKQVREAIYRCQRLKTIYI